jgi:hypothetical protein
MRLYLLLPVLFLVAEARLTAAERILDAKLHHLRVGNPREWNDFPEQAEAPSLTVRFQAEANSTEQTLRLRQQDVKQTWKVLLNGKLLSTLPPDQNDQVLYLPLPPAALTAGENTLTIEQVGKIPNDVRIGEIAIDDRPPDKALSEATVEVSVTDADKKGQPLPCRITVVNDSGALMTAGIKSGAGLAVRPGVIYTASGRARFGLPAGKYTIHAGRGFAYGIDSATITVKAGDSVRRELAIRREVPTPGWVSCDTHVHTLTHSGHGDSRIDERMITLAGEQIDLPIATDHNVHIDYQATAVKQGVRSYFTPVIGNEVTTAVGHFCVFPVPLTAPPPDYKLKEWRPIFDSIDKAGARVVILNHARDLHSGYRPFGPKAHNPASGDNLDDWVLRANAMEIINSGAVQTDPLELTRDWLTMLNRGNLLTPVGSSDSHDVSRYIVGQGRTYIRARDDDPGKIDVDEAVKSFLAGRVMVSYGLLTELTVNDKFGPGELVPPSEQVKVRVRVLGPGWTRADRVELYVNGRKLHEADIRDGTKAGVKWSGEWALPRLKHDVHIVAVATGPGITELYWPVARPYQPSSPVLNLHVLGVSGAVWIDGDGDGQRTSARGYAEKLLQTLGKDPEKLLPALAAYDEAVALHAAALLHADGIKIDSPEILALAKKAGAHVERGFRTYFEAWRQCAIERDKKP